MAESDHNAPEESTPASAAPQENIPASAAPQENTPVSAALDDSTPVSATSQEGAAAGVAPQAQAPASAVPAEGAPATAVPQRRPFVPREERDRRRREALEGLTVGEWREGRVTSVVQFGAFVDIGGIDGLVHISQLGAGGYVEKAEDVVQPGQTVRVRVVEVDRDRGRIGLSMREPNAPRPSRPPMDRPAASPGGFGSAPAPAAHGGSMPEEGGSSGRRPERSAAGPRARGGSGGGGGEQFRNSENRPRTNRRRDQEESEDWRAVRGGDARDYYAVIDDESESEPAPTTAEELVARFNKGRK